LLYAEAAKMDGLGRGCKMLWFILGFLLGYLVGIAMLAYLALTKSDKIYRFVEKYEAKDDEHEEGGEKDGRISH